MSYLDKYMAKSSTTFRPGNKASLKHGIGRPPSYDLVKEAQELLEWAQNPDSTAIYQFTRNKVYLYDDFERFSEQSPDFAEAYKKAKELVGQNREEKCNSGELNYGVWQRSAGLYHDRLNKYERGEKVFEIEAKARALMCEAQKVNLSELAKQLGTLDIGQK